MLRVGAPLVAAFCGGALSGCGQSAYSPKNVQEAWDNHFAAFGAGVGAKTKTSDRSDALDKIMLDYDKDSIVSIWDATKSDADNCKDGETKDCKPKTEHTGLDAIRNMFDGLFDDLDGCTAEGISNGLDAKLKVVEPAGSAPGSVFLVWECPKAGFNKATDTFVFDGVVIRKQNIVIETASTLASHGTRQPVSFSQGLLAQDEYKPDKVQTAWDNHFAAFDKGAKGAPGDEHKEALDMIMKDYIEDSVVHIASYEEGKTDIPEFEPHKGIKGIRQMFKDLFDFIPKTCDLAAPLVEVTGDAGSAAKQVFLVWRIPSSGFKWATDTFVFDDNFKITKQNIVAVRAAAKTCPGSESSIVV